MGVITISNNKEKKMNLKNYLEDNNLTVYLFSAMCRLSVPVIYRVLNNKNIAPKSARRIYNVTKGKVDYKNIQTFNRVSTVVDDESN